MSNVPSGRSMTMGRSGSSCSSAMSPTMVSTRSSMVSKPSMPPVFIDNKSKVHAGHAHLQQQVQSRDLRCNHQRFAQNGLKAELLRFAGIGKTRP